MKMIRIKFNSKSFNLLQILHKQQQQPAPPSKSIKYTHSQRPLTFIPIEIHFFSCECFTRQILFSWQWKILIAIVDFKLSNLLRLHMVSSWHCQRTRKEKITFLTTSRSRQPHNAKCIATYTAKKKNDAPTAVALK